MDLMRINNINELKAMAYDLIANIETQKRNLGIVQQRIAQLSEAPAGEKPKKTK